MYTHVGNYNLVPFFRKTHYGSGWYYCY